MSRKIVEDGCIDLMFNYPDSLLLGLRNCYEIRQIHCCVCGILLGISYDKTLYPALATARVLEFLQQAMTDYIHHDDNIWASKLWVHKFFACVKHA